MVVGYGSYRNMTGVGRRVKCWRVIYLGWWMGISDRVDMVVKWGLI
jgi:hypothetical protein